MKVTVKVTNLRDKRLDPKIDTKPLRTLLRFSKGLDFQPCRVTPTGRKDLLNWAGDYQGLNLGSILQGIFGNVQIYESRPASLQFYFKTRFKNPKHVYFSISNAKYGLSNAGIWYSVAEKLHPTDVPLTLILSSDPYLSLYLCLDYIIRCDQNSSLFFRTHYQHMKHFYDFEGRSRS